MEIKDIVSYAWWMLLVPVIRWIYKKFSSHDEDISSMQSEINVLHVLQNEIKSDILELKSELKEIGNKFDEKVDRILEKLSKL